jgi:C-3',4' desaturase CrtD
MTPHIIIIGAGIGGLTAGAVLLKAGYRVTVLEAHVYPGGCAGTFFHKKYRFDAGATLAGGFALGGPHHQLAEILGDLVWPIAPVDPAWVVHLPDGRAITQWADPAQWEAEWRGAFPRTAEFWRRQQMLADVSWDISTRHFPWPPERVRDVWGLATAVRPRTLQALPYLFRTIGSLAPQDDPMFNSFLDAQLLISAQATAGEANALYGSAALDLPRRGVNHVQGGIGALAETLAGWIQAHGGEVLYRQEVTGIELGKGGKRATAVQTKRGLRLEADFILANLTPWAVNQLLGEDAPPRLSQQVAKLSPTWGAFMVYLGIDQAKFKARFPDAVGHHQVILDPTKPLGETNSVFISLADFNDASRAPAGESPITMSTHTEISQWWAWHKQDSARYAAQKALYLEKMLAGAEQALPGLRDCITFQTTGTPVTFQRFTRRPQGMVGGFPQKSIWRARGPSTAVANLLLVGDSIFPGQSTAGVTLGGLRVARMVEQQLAMSNE